MDARGRIAFATRRLAAMFGYTPEELQGESVETLVPEAARSRHVTQRDVFQREPRSRPMGLGLELEGRRKDGTTFPIEISLSTHQNTDGHITAIVSDITARKHIERQVRLHQSLSVMLAESHTLSEAARHLLASVCREFGWDFGSVSIVDRNDQKLVPVAMWHLDDPRLATFADYFHNQAFLLGEGGLGRAWKTSSQHWASDISMELPTALQQAGRAADLRAVFICPIGTDREVVGVMAFASLRRREPDDLVISLLEDVGRQFAQFARRKESEADLTTSEGRFRQLFDRAPFGICRASTEFRILDANPALLQLLECNALEELQARNLSSEVFASEEDCRRLFRQKELRPDETIECDWKTRSNRSVRVRLTGIPERDNRGSVQAMGIFVEDVTDRRRLEEEYRHTTKMEALGQLASGVAHDFNNLLTVISVDADMLLDRTPEDGTTRQLVEEIDRTVERGADLVRRLLAFSRRQPESLRLVEVDSVIEALRPMLLVLLGESIELHLQLNSPSIFAYVDTSELEQVLMNLAVNARDAMESSGKLTITTVFVDDEGTGPEICLDVVDTGSGIPPEVQARIFEPFFTTKEAGKGTGLGLFTVYGIVRQFGGRIQCNSTAGEGTQFRVVLPATRTRPAEDNKVTPDSPTAETGGTVLVVEDTVTIRRSVRDILSRAGYVVLDAGTAHEGLECARSHHGRIDLLLTDVGLPQMRGDELASLLRVERPDLKVVFMSGYSQNPADQGIEGHYLPKPFKRHILLSTVRKVLLSGRAHGA